MSKRQVNRQGRPFGGSMFIKGFLLGMTGPGAYFIAKRRASVSYTPASVSDAWSATGKYIGRAIDSERKDVQKAVTSGKVREIAR